MMSTLKTNHYNWDKNTRREMTLNEFVGQLPIGHCARKEFKALQAKIARLKDEVKRLMDDVTDLEPELRRKAR